MNEPAVGECFGPNICEVVLLELTSLPQSVKMETIPSLHLLAISGTQMLKIQSKLRITIQKLSLARSFLVTSFLRPIPCIFLQGPSCKS